LKKINSGFFANKELYFDDNGFITPLIPPDFAYKKHGQDKQCSMYYDGKKQAKRTVPCCTHDFMCAVAKTVKERFIADLVLAYNIKHINTKFNKYFHFWFMSLGTIPYGFIKHLIS